MDGTFWTVFNEDDRENPGDDRVVCHGDGRGYFVFADVVLLVLPGGVTARMMCVLGVFAERSACQTGRNDMDAAGDGSEFAFDRRSPQWYGFLILWIAGKIWYERRMKRWSRVNVPDKRRGAHRMRAEWQKMRHTILLPIHVAVPLLGAGVFLLYYWIGNRHGIAEISGFMQIMGTVFPFLAAMVCSRSIQLEEDNHFQTFLRNSEAVKGTACKMCGASYPESGGSASLPSEVLRSDTMCCFTQRS